MQEQHYKNHSRYIPLFHFGTYGAISILLGYSVYRLILNYQHGSGMMVPALFILTSLILLSLTWYARVFALKAQDRAIRAEENLRHFALTGKLLDSKLRTSQVVALRFAPDNEFPDLAKKAVAENMSSSEIKKAISNWKGDHHRV